MFWSTPHPALPLADLIAQGQVVDLFRSCGEWSRALKWPFVRTLTQGACWALLPRRWQALTRHEARLGEWLDARFAKRTDLPARMLGMVDDLGFRLPSTSIQYRLVRKTFRLHVVEWCSSEGWVDVRYPYLDRRVIEFALAIPLEQCVRPFETRSLVRRALRGILPEPVRTRKTKAGPSEAFCRALVREWGWVSTLLKDPRVAAHGFVDRAAFLRALDRARHGVVTSMVQLLRTVSLEIWLRTLEQSPLPAPSPHSAERSERRAARLQA